MMAFAARAWVLLLGVAMLGGCAGSPEPSAAIVRTEPPREYGVVASVHNDRVSRLDQLWSRTVVVIRYPDDEGGRHSDQGEGHLLLSRPDRVMMTVGVRATGQTLVHLGCNEEQYWWFDLYEDKRVWVGRHDGPGAAGGGGAGLVLQPRDLIALLGIVPVPAEMPAGGEWRWSGDGRTIFAEFPAGSVEGVEARQRVWFDPETLHPKWVALLDDLGDEVIVSELGEYARFPVAMPGGAGPMGPMLVKIWDDADTLEVKIRLWAPENKELSESAFDFDGLLGRYRVSEIHDLDESAAAPAAVDEQ